MNTKTRKKSSKEKIIFESLRLFSLKGFKSTSISDIINASHMSKGGFYNHFKSKEKLFSAVLSEARKIWREKNLTGLDLEDRYVNKVKKILRNFKDYYLKDSVNFPGGCVFITLSVELDDQLPNLSNELSEGFTKLKAMIKRYLDRAKSNGEIREDIATEAISEVIFAGMIGASVTYGMNKSDADLEKTINTLIGYLETVEH